VIPNDKICEQLAHLASLEVQRRYISNATADEYLLPEELLENAHSLISQINNNISFRQAMPTDALKVILDLEPLIKEITDEDLCSKDLIEHNPRWRAVRNQATYCLEILKFDLREWEKRYQ